jgi:hypothetical protein
MTHFLPSTEETKFRKNLRAALTREDLPEILMVLMDATQVIHYANAPLPARTETWYTAQYTSLVTSHVGPGIFEFEDHSPTGRTDMVYFMKDKIVIIEVSALSLAI